MRGKVAGFTCLLLIVLLATTVPRPVLARARVDKLVACRELAWEQPVPFLPPYPAPRDCADRFTTNDPLVWLVVEAYLEHVTRTEVMLLGPGRSKVWEWRGHMGPPPSRYGTYWAIAMLPIKQTPADVVRAYPGLSRGVVQEIVEGDYSSVLALVRAQGTPGEWTFQVSLGRGQPLTLRFVLVAP